MTDRADRPLAPALLNGFRRRCPRCGRGAAFDGFLRVRDECADCGQALHHHRADDAPAWATMLVVGHLMIPLIMLARGATWPVEAHMIVWPLVSLGLCLVLLPRVKGAIVAYQWALRMHGFDERARAD